MADDRPLRTAVLSFIAATVAVFALGMAARGVPLVAANLGALVAFVFLGMAAWGARRRGQDLVDYGFTWAPLGRGLGFGFGVPAIVFPVFAIVFVGFYAVVCDAGSLASLAPPGFCARFRGLDGMRAPELGWGFAEAVLVQVVVVALPEELFFRGFVHELCERALPPKRRWLGGGLGWALVISSALFALGHLAVAPDPRRLAVFFPGLLFGWMRSATGSILAGTIAHASSNLFIDVLQDVFL